MTDKNQVNFPASAGTPGQAESETAYQIFQETGRLFEWWQDYLEIRREFPHFRNWRIWVYVAWAGSPLRNRDPATEEELAREVLGCTDRAIRNWKSRTWTDEKEKALPTIEEAIAWTQAAPLLQHRRDVIEALVTVATKHDHLAHPDRKMFLTMTGDYNPKLEHTGDQDEPIVVKVIKGIDIEQL